MNKELLFEAIGGINDAYLLRSEVRQTGFKRKLISITAFAACFCLLLSGGFWFADKGRGYMGGVTVNGVEVSNPVIKGTDFTTAEIDNVLKENNENTIALLSEELKIDPQNILIGKNGYRYLSVSGNSCVLDLDYYNLPVFANGRWIAEITIFRNDEIIDWNLSYGGPRSEYYHKLFSENKGKSFVLLHVDTFTEVAISSDNEIYSYNNDITGFFDDNTDYYSSFKTDYNVIYH